ncbi:EcsC family protein [Arcticibacter tournemirensis]|uniref:EcsC family protein n=1 Tax=Arcticibacter tournemirensis TaxID=699437 RepID=A0A5M9HEP0_9SPHI|nr:EcsC family protein [Arcticibacter tournemirensis]KAA8483367.1 EcsC family protein [Arcticibacter tournemirensis]TQM50943.1 EcsC family protein [Arcticibacter tournemirensis]
MMNYEDQARAELQAWQQKMQQDPGLFDKLSKRAQDRINRMIPEKAHAVITTTIQKMVEAVLFGAKYTSARMLTDVPLQFRENQLQERISFYRNSAVAEGAVTGAGGILLGLADFPLLLGLKLKFLFDAASVYGFDVKDYKERLYILYIFQLTFSSRKKRKETYKLIENWHTYEQGLPEKPEDFDWRSFQQEYRDYIDLAKMAQLLPVIGAAVGAIANYKLMNQLGEAAKNAYRMRLL